MQQIFFRPWTKIFSVQVVEFSHTSIEKLLTVYIYNIYILVCINAYYTFCTITWFGFPFSLYFYGLNVGQLATFLNVATRDNPSWLNSFFKSCLLLNLSRTCLENLRFHYFLNSPDPRLSTKNYKKERYIDLFSSSFRFLIRF